jgi:hypothetical protein
MTLVLLAGERKPGESNRAVQACNDYLRMGPGRSLVDLIKKYTESDQTSPPTTSIGTLKAWSSKLDWESRSIAYDRQLEDQKTDRANEVMRSGLALPHKRVEKLKRLAKLLEDEIYEEDTPGHKPKVWVRDVKAIGSGEFAHEVWIERFNGTLISEYRSTLEDLAKETGGRIHRTDLTTNGKDLPAATVTVYLPDNHRDSDGSNSVI